MIDNWQVVPGVVQQGHQIASGWANYSPYPKGSIAMQMPYFQALGLDLSALFNGTLNISIYPATFVMQHPTYTFREVHWTAAHPPETFSFSPCQLRFQSLQYEGFVYYPHPETKQRHFQNSAILEILAPPIAGIGYRDRVELALNPTEILIVNPQES
ncbi:hypothetical protein JOY44_16985 [Phormidium sp. CLA17]|uniref:hypothetical protein n=1 Tax=Leptolyngbya sp. Cla-17 TaxID=2803751 RepID=UPI0014925BCE|nr:hypothetical protein [Leptolyngbya sp. Cla-17]MBM0743287.1 hypothetical protein [Leptolyngbya sp. Cla-17]